MAARYRGSWLGIAWMVLQPAVMVAVFTLVFDQFLNVRWPSAITEGGSALVAALNIFLGLVLFNYAAEQLNTAASSILEHPQYVKKVKFPLPLIGWVNAAAGLVPALVGLGIAAAFAALLRGSDWTAWWLLPASLLALLPWALAAQWGLGALGVYLRDLTQVLPPLTTLLMFLSPVFYPLAVLSPLWQRLLWLNPLTGPIEAARAAVLGHAEPSVWLAPLLTVAFAGCTVALLARWLFHRLAPGFGEAM